MMTQRTTPRPVPSFLDAVALVVNPLSPSTIAMLLEFDIDLALATSKYRETRRYRYPTSGLVQGKVSNSSPGNFRRPCDERGGACDVIYFLCTSNVIQLCDMYGCVMAHTPR